MMKRFGAASLFLSLPILLIVQDAASPEQESVAVPKLANVEIERPAVGDLANLLHVQKVTGRFDIVPKTKSVSFVVELYKRGERVTAAPILRTGLGLDPVATSGQFAVQIADLDQLSFGDGERGHARVLLELGLSGDGVQGTSKTIEDIPKVMCDLTRLTGYTNFSWKVAEGNRIPVFCMVSPEGRYMTITVSEILKKNPEADVLAAYIELEPVSTP